jgi:hypothetical protein
LRGALRANTALARVCPAYRKLGGGKEARNPTESSIRNSVQLYKLEQTNKVILAVLHAQYLIMILVAAARERRLVA